MYLHGNNEMFETALLKCRWKAGHYGLDGWLVGCPEGEDDIRGITLVYYLGVTKVC